MAVEAGVEREGSMVVQAGTREAVQVALGVMVDEGAQSIHRLSKRAGCRSRSRLNSTARAAPPCTDGRREPHIPPSRRPMAQSPSPSCSIRRLGPAAPRTRYLCSFHPRCSSEPLPCQQSRPGMWAGHRSRHTHPLPRAPEGAVATLAAAGDTVVAAALVVDTAVSVMAEEWAEASVASTEKEAELVDKGGEAAEGASLVAAAPPVALAAAAAGRCRVRSCPPVPWSPLSNSFLCPTSPPSAPRHQLVRSSRTGAHCYQVGCGRSLRPASSATPPSPRRPVCDSSAPIRCR